MKKKIKILPYIKREELYVPQTTMADVYLVSNLLIKMVIEFIMLIPMIG